MAMPLDTNDLLSPGRIPRKRPRMPSWRKMLRKIPCICKCVTCLCAGVRVHVCKLYIITVCSCCIAQGYRNVLLVVRVGNIGLDAVLNHFERPRDDPAERGADAALNKGTENS